MPVEDWPATGSPPGLGPTTGPEATARDVVVRLDVEVPMRDGCRLRADIWQPLAPGRYPALVQRTPYGKGVSSGSVVAAGIEPAAAASRGWVVVIQDVRGRFASEGVFEPFRHEGADGFDTIEWVARQDWCNGEVFMYGQSYVGATQLLAAAEQPPHLRGIATNLTSSRVRDGWTHQGGAFQLGFCVTWGIALAADAVRRAGRPEDVTALEALAGSVPEQLDVNAVSLSADVRRLAPWIAQWRETSLDSPFWDTVDADLTRIAVPALHIGGWYDLFLAGTLGDFESLRRSTAAGVAEGQFLIVGPWAHGSLTDHVGDLYFGPRSAQAVLAMTDLHLDWFAEIRSGRFDRPRARVFSMGVNRWEDHDEWPPTGTSPLELHLGRTTSAAVGTLSRAATIHGAPSTDLVVDPGDPAPTIGGPNFLPGVHVGRNSGPRDRARVHDRADVVVFETDVLVEPVTVNGPVRAELHLETDEPALDCCVALVDVDESGVGRLLCEGITRQSTGHEAPVQRVEVDMVATNNVFLPGHRIRVDVSTGSFPRFDSVWPGAGSSPPRLRIHHTADSPSLVVLPVRGEPRTGSRGESAISGAHP